MWGRSKARRSLLSQLWSRFKSVIFDCSPPIAFFKLRVTFNVYNDNQGIEKIFPFDIIPRIIDSNEWKKLEQGLKQRIQTLNLFLNDLYGSQKIIKDGKIPAEIIYAASGFLKPCLGINPPRRS
nr:circularly permuted type 2 ATP-grasp protein [Pleurocapsa sp. PCC 7319]